MPSTGSALSLLCGYYHLHSVAEDELLCGDAVDPIHEFLFVQEEPLEPHVEAVAGRYAGFIKLIQLLHN